MIKQAGCWRWDSLISSLAHEDKYAIRHVEPLQYRVVAFKYHKTSYRYSDTVAFYYEHYASWTDAIQAARNWCMRDELERGESAPYDLAPGLYRVPDPVIERRGW